MFGLRQQQTLLLTTDDKKVILTILMIKFNKVISYYYNIGLLPERIKCRNCSNPFPLTLPLLPQNSNDIQKFQFICFICRKKYSATFGTYFYKSKIPIHAFDLILYCFLSKIGWKEASELTKGSF